MDNCLFCKIIRGEIPSYTIYEDEIAKAFMDINPVTNGHSLIIPKKHYDNIYDIEPDELLHMQKVAKILMKEYKEKLGAEGFTLVQNNELGQEVKHYHLHLMPRYQDDQLRTESDQSQIKDIEEIFGMLK